LSCQYSNNNSLSYFCVLQYILRRKNMATQQVDGSAVTTTSTKNQGGAVVNGGTTSILDTVNLGYSDVGVFGTAVIDNNSADKALSAGTFSYNNQSPIAKRVTGELSGVANTVLQSGADQPGLIRSIHKLETLRTRRLTTAIRAGYWNIYTGAFSPAPTVAVDSLSTDEAATPTRSVPGELVYKTGAPTPVQDNYKAKTG
jgi:hypothetical protein